jgi:hypothetical protein
MDCFEEIEMAVMMDVYLEMSMDYYRAAQMVDQLDESTADEKALSTVAYSECEMARMLVS